MSLQIIRRHLLQPLNNSLKTIRFKIEITLKRLKLSWGVFKGKGTDPVTLSQDKILRLINTIQVSEHQLAKKYGERLYNIVEMAVPNDKLEILRRGCDDVIGTMLESIVMHVVVELDSINEILNGRNTEKLHPESKSSAGEPEAK